MLRDALSDGIRVGSHFIKECALQLKASISLKGLQLVMDKNQEVAEAYSKNINVRNHRRLLRNLLSSMKVQNVDD